MFCRLPSVHHWSAKDTRPAVPVTRYETRHCNFRSASSDSAKQAQLLRSGAPKSKKQVAKQSKISEELVATHEALSFHIDPAEQLAKLRLLIDGFTGKHVWAIEQRLDEVWAVEQTCRVKDFLRRRSWGDQAHQAQSLLDAIEEKITSYIDEGLPYRDKTHSPGL
eukprot:TRINITY_DN14863_c0_g1_i1.p1 TRINITY_DN14863_c0_g1~~TRINITY_DN14863_c0_g1_i1.p1  ORF type:complete len:165 (-),score=22.83 TRINITY_DN14863_c0_g1_i1:610-1104(-)